MADYRYRYILIRFGPKEEQAKMPLNLNGHLYKINSIYDFKYAIDKFNIGVGLDPFPCQLLDLVNNEFVFVNGEVVEWVNDNILYLKYPGDMMDNLFHKFSSRLVIDSVR